MSARIFLAVFLACTASTALGLSVLFAGNRVFYNGKPITSNARSVGGQVFVPLADIARAFDLSIKKRSDGNYDLAPAGGAGMIATKLVGNMGDELFTGKWRFQALSIARMKTREPVYLPKESYNRIEAKRGQELIVVKCRIKNGTKARDGLVLGKWDGNNTALTTTEEQSIEPYRIGYDAVFNEHFPNGARLLPGAALDFYLIFEAPESTKVKDLVFTIVRYDDRAPFVMKNKPPVDIRVHLSEP